MAGAAGRREDRRSAAAAPADHCSVAAAPADHCSVAAAPADHCGGGGPGGPLFGGGGPGGPLFGGGPPGMLCGALGPVFTDGIFGTSIIGLDAADGADGWLTELTGYRSTVPTGISIDGADGISIDDIDDDDPKSLELLDDDDPKSLKLLDDDDPESLLGDGGSGSLGESGNDPGPGATAGSGKALAFAIAAPNRIRFTSMPVAIAAVRTRCFVVMMRLPVDPSDAEITNQDCGGAITGL